MKFHCSSFRAFKDSAVPPEYTALREMFEYAIIDQIEEQFQSFKNENLNKFLALPNNPQYFFQAEKCYDEVFYKLRSLGKLKVCPNHYRCKFETMELRNCTMGNFNFTYYRMGSIYAHSVRCGYYSFSGEGCILS